MDGLEKLLLTNSLISSTSNDSKSFIYGLIIGFMSCLIILIFIMTCYNTFKNSRYEPMVYNNPYNIPSNAQPSYIPLNNIQDIEKFINYQY